MCDISASGHSHGDPSAGQ